ncbi:LysR family transcriptional regulator [Microvirgula aerodenitrificans]|uniref:LysR family transcriptional regulator n=1 Tax=Microvirgula aerodenitrificans TaxID=57480 RepID=UPI0028EC0576|nr:LysR family transcriptional regulator [Microvirgula aerodenitrificans]
MELLNDMALFVAVVKAKGFRHAAEAVGMPNSTVSRRISALEKAIGLRLLHRTTRRIELTEAGQLYYERCKRIVDEARLAHEQLGTLLAQPTGTLRASLPVDFANTYLAPLIAEFAGRYPGIRFDLDLTPRLVDLVAEPFDVAIRMGKPPDSGLIARQLASLSSFLYASPRYIEQAGEPRHPLDLAQHACLGFRTGKAGTWTLHRGEESVAVAVDGRFQLNSAGLIRRLSSLDQGIAVLPAEIVDEEVAQGRLRRILPDWEGPSTPVYAMTETRLLPAKTQRFIEFLRERLNR